MPKTFPLPYKRLFEVDALRAFAILLMVYTHTAIFFLDTEVDFWIWLASFGGWICFSIFLFDSAATLPIMVEHRGEKEAAQKLLQRAGIFYLLYLLIGILYSLPLGPGQFWEIAFFQDIPIFADFILPFSFFFLIGSFVVWFVKDARRIITLWIISVILLFLGYLAYHLPVAENLIPYKALFVGDGDLHRFPIFQYTIVYMSGIMLARFHREFENLRGLLMLAWYTALLTLISIAFTGFERWQASPGFIIFGIWVIFSLITLGKLLQKYLKGTHKVMQKPIIRISKEASGVLVIHLVVLLFLIRLVSMRFDILPTLLMFGLVMLISLFVGKWIKL